MACGWVIGPRARARAWGRAQLTAVVTWWSRCSRGSAGGGAEPAAGHGTMWCGVAAVFVVVLLYWLAGWWVWRWLRGSRSSISSEVPGSGDCLGRVFFRCWAGGWGRLVQPPTSRVDWLHGPTYAVSPLPSSIRQQQQQHVTAHLGCLPACLHGHLTR